MEARLTFEERLKVIIGDLVFQNASLIGQVEEKDAKIKLLENPPEPKPE